MVTGQSASSVVLDAYICKCEETMKAHKDRLVEGLVLLAARLTDAFCLPHGMATFRLHCGLWCAAAATPEIPLPCDGVHD